MEIENLKTFRRVAMVGSISKAADDLFLSVSTVTGRIKTLEEELGKQLFLRVGRRIDLTDEGAKFLITVNRFFEILDSGIDKMSNLREAYIGQLNLAVNTTIANYVFPKLLMNFRKTYPHIHIKMIAASNEDVLQLVNQGEVELGITDGTSDEDGMIIRPWFVNLIVPVVSSEHPLRDKKKVTPVDLGNYPILGYASENQERENLRCWFADAGLQPNIMMDVAHIEILKKLLEQLNAVSFLPRISIMEELEDNKLTTVSLDPKLMLKRETHFVHRNNLEVSMAIRTFIEYCSLHIHGLLSPGRKDSAYSFDKLRKMNYNKIHASG